MAIRVLMSAFVLLVTVRTAHSVEETQYFALFLEGKKAGHAAHSRCESGGKIVTTQQVSLTAQRLGVPLTINMKEEHIESKDGKPIGFGVVQDLGIMKMEVEGTVKEMGLLEVKTKSMGAEQQVTLEWPRGAVMAEGLRLLQKKKGLKKGTQYSVSVFSAAMLQPIELEISIGGKCDVDLLGRVVQLTEVKTVQRLAAQPGALPAQEPTQTQADTNSPAIEIIETSYVDSELHVQKHTSSVMGFEVEMIACAKEFALGENDVPELIDKMLLASPQPLDDISSIRSITYYLRPTDDSANLRIPSTDNQSVKAGERNLVEVIVEPIGAPQAASFPYKGKERTVLAAMKPTRFLQSDREQIVKLAREAIGDTKDAGQAVRRIEEFVAQYIDNKGLSVGYASAAEVAATRQGDCTEFAVLTAAMCRAVGIPAHVVMGMAYVEDFVGLKDRFGGHAWVQAHVGDRWVGLDAAFKSAGGGGYDPGHIALAIGDGNPEDFFSLVDTFGKFQIERLVVKRNDN